MAAEQDPPPLSRKEALGALQDRGIIPDVYRINGPERFGLRIAPHFSRETVRFLVSALAEPERIYRVDRFDSKYDDRWLDELSALPNLVELNVNTCKISQPNDEEAFVAISTLPQLQSLLISRCGVTDRMLNSLQSESLHTLSLWGNSEVSKACLNKLAKNLPSLGHVCFSETRITETAARAAFQARQIDLEF